VTPARTCQALDLDPPRPNSPWHRCRERHGVSAPSDDDVRRDHFTPVRPVMTLYNYIDNRAAAEDLVVDAASAQIGLPGTEDWAADVRNVATAIWKTVRAHPAAIPWFPPTGHRLPRAWAKPTRSRALSRGLNRPGLLSASRPLRDS
jgi:hypothetical protein